MKIRSESGIALVSALLILVLLGVLLEGFILSVNSDQSLLSVDRDQNRSFYAALAGLEQLTADLGNLYNLNYSPTVAQISALTASPPSLAYTSFVSPGGGSGYQIEYPTTSGGKPKADNRTVPTGPYEGLVGMMTPFTMTVTARTVTGGEVRMRRSLQTVEVPVFQFGIFSETDLSFFAGPNFDFGGRVHTNGNLFLAEGSGSTLTMKDRVTAVGEVVRTNLNNGWNTSSNYTGTVKIITSPGSFRNLTSSEGSLTGTIGSTKNSGWTNISIGTYNGNIRNGDTGARRMDLPLVSMGAAPVDLIRRPAINSNENTANPDVYGQRYFALASLRIILSDNESDITSLPSMTSGSPVNLSNPVVIGSQTQYVGLSNRASSGSNAEFRSPKDTPLIGGFIKIEMQDAARAWHDVTSEILALGISGRDLTGSCSSFNPNSIIRVQRLKDSPLTSPCGGSASQQPYQYWPNTLYDAREGVLRDNIGTGDGRIYLGGIMHYVELDVNNLARWFRGDIAGSGTSAINETGYVVYFSDRRTNKNASNLETGEYGFEDFVNPGDVANGLPNGALETGEDVNQNNIPDTYGKTAQVVTGALYPLDSNAHPQNYLDISAGIARKNRAILFRRALKLVNGASFDLGSDSDGVPYGLAVASENPVYVQGNYNAPGTFDTTHRACSIIADAVTLLSNAWNDATSFSNPNNPGGRRASDSWYRTAIIAGKQIPFPNINMSDVDKRDFGTDGGVHNFLRYLEDWTDRSLKYKGSIVSLFFNRQATGTYKCCTNVYSPPSRGYSFDVEFLQPSLLPPRTPMFHDVNITGFTQIRLPNK